MIFDYAAGVVCMKTARWRRGPAIAVLAATLALGGCTDTPAGQTTAEACTIAAEGLRPVDSSVSVAMSKLSLGDIDGARIAINDLDRKLDVTGSKIKQRDIVGRYKTIRATLSQIVPVFNDLSAKDAMKDTSRAAAASANLTQISTQLQADAADLNRACAGN